MGSPGSLDNRSSPPFFQSQPIHHLGFAHTSAEFAEILNERKLLISPSGRHVAQIRGGRCHRLDLEHPSGRTCTFVTQAILLWVTPQETLFWGQGQTGQHSGVYRVRRQKSRLIERLDRLDLIHNTINGPLLCGANEGDDPKTVRFVLPNRGIFILANEPTSLNVRLDGAISLLEARAGLLCHSCWHPDGSLQDIRVFGPNEQVQVMPWQEGYAYITDHGDTFDFDTFEIDMFDFEPHQTLPGQIEFFWASPSQKHIFFLVRRPERGRLGCDYRQLYLDGELVEDADGYFEMGPDDLRWSRDDSQFITRVKMHQLNAEGESVCVNRLITSAGQVFDAPANFELREMAVDNHGEISFYVLSDERTHYPFSYGQPLEPADFIWNLRSFEKSLSGNRLVQDRIERFRLPRRA